MSADTLTYAALARAERRLAATIAERAVEHPDPGQTKFLRHMWQIATARAGYFEEFSFEKERRS